MEINEILVVIAVIVFLGYVAEWVFRKINIPDTLLLIVVGLIMRDVINLDPGSLGRLAPLFTTFTLLFLMFDGALSIDLRTLTQSIGSGISIGFFNFFASSIVISIVFYFMIGDVVIAMMLGFALGGISSAFVIPILKQLTVSKKVYSVLTLESALTDVLSIVFALTMIELKILNAFEIKGVFSQIASLFFVAGVMGMIAGAVWIYVEGKLVEKDTNYMMTIAYVILLYSLTEYLGGNGAIAAMSFGIVLTNADLLVDVANRLRGKRQKNTEDGKTTHTIQRLNVVSRREKSFYEEISFFLKTFFFVYIGLLLNIRNWKAALIGTGISAAILLLRSLTSFLTTQYKDLERMLINSLFARGIAPAAIILLAEAKHLPIAPDIVDTVYYVITTTIIFSSLRVFIYKRKAS